MKYPRLCYRMIKFDKNNFINVFNNIEDYGEIENNWLNNDNDKFRLLYPNLLK